jgi:hypothetical protein
MIETTLKQQVGSHAEIGGQAIAVSAVDARRIPSEKERIEREGAELLALGLQIARIVLPAEGAPRYEFFFPSGELQYKTRLRLEQAGFDVGQHVGSQQLTFYATRRSERSDGWAV